MAANAEVGGGVEKIMDDVRLDEERSQPRRSPFSNLKSLLREPLLHFILLGTVLFAIYGYMHRGLSGVEPSYKITLTPDDLSSMAIFFKSQWGRDPTPEEFQGMAEGKVREEVLYREGLAMGLDKDDTIVKRRMAQKMQFLAEDVAASREPTTAELKAWYEKNSDKFAMPSRFSFHHLYFSPDKRGKSAQQDAARALAIVSQPEHTARGASLADPFMFQDYYGDRDPSAIAKEFGVPFAVALEKLKPGSWQGPLQSGYGWHLVFVDSVIPGRVPDFEEVEPEVKTAWLADQKAQAWRTTYAALRAKYTVQQSAPADMESARTSGLPASQDVPTSSGEQPP